MPASGTTDLGRFILRVAIAAMMLYGHGWGKFTGWAERSGSFGDPLHIGSQASLALAIFAECFCSSLLILGLATRLATIPLIITMLVAAFLVNGAAPWGEKELAMLYLVPLVAIALLGPGPWSLDAQLRQRLKGPLRKLLV